MHSLVRLLRYARPWRGRIILAVFYSTLNKLFDIAPEILIGVAVDVVVKREESFVAQLGFETPQSQIAALGVATFLIWAFESLTEYLYSVEWRRLAQSIQHSLRMDAYDHAQRLDQAWFEENSVGNLQATLNDDVNQLERFLDTGASEMIQLTVSTIAIGAVFFYLEPTIAVLAVVPVPAIFICSSYFQRNLGPRYTRVRDAAAAVNAALANNLGGIATIKSFVKEDEERARVAELSRAYQGANSDAIRVSSAFFPVIRMAILAGFLCTLVIGGLKTFDGTLAVSAYSVLIFLTQRFLWPFTKLGQTVDLFERAMASTRRILNLLETGFAIREPAEPKPLARAKGAIAFEDVNFAYGSGPPIFCGLSLTVPAGGFVALVGGTGSGKSSLVKLLLRFYDVDGGRVTVDGMDVREVSVKALRDNISLVSQDVFLFQGTVCENIAYGRSGASREEVVAAAKLSEAHDFIERLPEGYDTVVGERGQKLSGGQRQRLSIARAILKNAPILILDEATSAVDNETEAAIQKSMEQVTRGKTTLVIAHRLSTIRHADMIHALEKGRVVESGRHDELVAKGGLYANLWRIQTGELVN